MEKIITKEELINALGTIELYKIQNREKNIVRLTIKEKVKSMTNKELNDLLFNNLKETHNYANTVELIILSFTNLGFSIGVNSSKKILTTLLERNVIKKENKKYSLNQ